MLTAFKLGNFKAFGETQTIPLRPLTLIFGPNSSGKSSIIHGLLFAHEANRTGRLDVQQTLLGGDSVDLGGFPQFVYRHDFAADVDWSVELDVRHLPQRSIEVLGPVGRLCVSLTIGCPGSEVSLTSYTIEADGRTLLSARGADLAERFIDHAHPLFQRVAMKRQLGSGPKASERRCRILKEAAESLIPRVTLRLNGFLPKGVTETTGAAAASDRSTTKSSKQRPQKDGLAAKVQFDLLRLLDEVIGGVALAMESELNRLIYLGPLRSYPPRHLAFDQYHDPNWRAGGGHAYDIARRDSKVQEKVNEWLGAKHMGTRYKLHVTRLLPPDAHEDAIGFTAHDLAARRDLTSLSADDFEHVIREGLEYHTEPEREGFDRSIPHFMWLYDKVAKTFVTHRDVGIGVSQVLPVLVYAFGSQNRIIAIEQPEIHLHPALQAELADVFIESALGERKNMFILETHSEHLILRVLRRIRESASGELAAGLTPIRPEDVAVLYVSPTPEGSKVTEIPIRADGEFAAPWPDGFFPDRAKELF